MFTLLNDESKIEVLSTRDFL